VIVTGPDGNPAYDHRMRILFPTLSRFPTDEAPAVQVANMAQAFCDQGHTVTLVAPSGPTVGLDAQAAEATGIAARFGFMPGFRIVLLSRRIHRGQSYLHAFRLNRMSRTGEFDLVFSRNLRACLLPALRGVPTVFEAHTLTSLQGRQDRWVLRRLLRAPGFRGIVAVSQALADDLRDALDVDGSRILAAHDAVRLRPDADVPLHPGPPKAPLRVGYTGSLFAGRGIEVLLEVARTNPWIELHLVGGPVDRAARLEAELRRGAERANVVIHGPVTPAEARRLQCGFDVLVAPFSRAVMTDSGVDSSRWMSPMKVFEYLASGRPIVISDLPVLREVLRPDIDALMVPPEDPEALAAALRRLADDPELGTRLAASAMERARTEFTWDLRARRILERFVPEAAGGHERA